MKLVGGIASHVGNVRDVNQDRAYFGESLAAVADGMGGHQGGEIAAQVAVSGFDALDGPVECDELLSLVSDANSAIFEKAIDPELRGMGTTLVVLALQPEGDFVTIANVGDSRAYHYFDGTLRQITVDHSLVQDLVTAGKITEEEAHVHPQRNIVTRALGISPTVEADSFTLPAQVGDRFLLCSDGLINEVEESRIAEILDEQDALEAANNLVQAAINEAGRDNVTVAIVDVVGIENEPAEGELDEDATVSPATVSPVTVSPVTVSPATVSPATVSPVTVSSATVSSAATSFGTMSHDDDELVEEDDDITEPLPLAEGDTVGLEEPDDLEEPESLEHSEESDTSEELGAPEEPDGAVGDESEPHDAEADAAGVDEDEFGEFDADLDAEEVEQGDGEDVVLPAVDNEVDSDAPGHAESATSPTATSAMAVEPSHKSPLGKILLAGVAAIILIAAAFFAVTWYSENSWYLSEDEGKVAIYNGRPGGFLWFGTSQEAVTDVEVADLDEASKRKVDTNLTVGSLAEAERAAENLTQKSRSGAATSETDQTQPSTTTSDSAGLSDTLPASAPDSPLPVEAGEESSIEAPDAAGGGNRIQDPTR